MCLFKSERKMGNMDRNVERLQGKYVYIDQQDVIVCLNCGFYVRHVVFWLYGETLLSC